MNEKVIVVGVGEIGKPLLELISQRYETYGLDLKLTAPVPEKCDIMHICFPFIGESFVTECVRYIKEYQPALVIINSTVSPGTTRQIAERSGSDVVYSPVRGKHARMKQEMLHYVKFIGSITESSGEKAAKHFSRIGMKVKILSTPEAAELAKLTETTYFGVLIAWAQEVERYCKAIGADYDEVVSFYEEIKFFPPVKFTPGFIGGHCVMPNIRILKQQFQSGVLDMVEKSNEIKEQNGGIDGWTR